MAWRVKFKKSFIQAVSKLEKEDRTRIIEKIERLMNTVSLGKGLKELDIKKLKGKWEGFFRLRVGSYRLIFKIDWDSEEVVFYALSKRSSAYR